MIGYLIKSGVLLTVFYAFFILFMRRICCLFSEPLRGLYARQQEAPHSPKKEKELCKLAGTHTSRRTFIVNALSLASECRDEMDRPQRLQGY